jgi:predicted esterase
MGGWKKPMGAQNQAEAIRERLREWAEQLVSHNALPVILVGYSNGPVRTVIVTAENIGDDELVAILGQLALSLNRHEFREVNHGKPQ